MFTGIVEETGTVERIKPAAKSIELTVRAKLCGRGLKVGASLAINGCCLTGVKLAKRGKSTMAQFDLLKETRVREMIRDGAIGPFGEVSAWGDRQVRRAGYLPSEGDPPSYLNYDLWLGPSPFHPYNSEYFKGGCLKWNMHWDWGSGQVGDMGSHTMDLAWNALEAGLPTSAEGKGEPFNPEVTPVKLETHFDIPANDWRSPIKVSWYQGGAMPDSPNRAIDLKAIDHGVLFEGSSGCLVADFQSRLLLPQGNVSDMTYYQPRSKAALLPPIANFQQEWIKACRGSLKTSCDFGYASDMIEMMLLGLVAYRVGKKIKYDGAAGRVTDCAEADELLRHTYREGWTLNG